MKEKKYIHRKVTNQSDFLAQFLQCDWYATQNKKETGYMAKNTMLMRAARHALGFKQTSFGFQKQRAMRGQIPPSQLVKSHTGTMGACHPHLQLHVPPRQSVYLCSKMECLTEG